MFFHAQSLIRWFKFMTWSHKLFPIVISIHIISWIRKRLFNMINDLPTVFEVVTGADKKQQKEKSSVTNNSSSKSKSHSKVVKGSLFCALLHFFSLLILSPVVGYFNLFWLYRSLSSESKTWFVSTFCFCFASLSTKATSDWTTPSKILKARFKGWRGRRFRRGRGRRWRGTWWHLVWCLWRELCIRWILDMLWYMWEVVPWQVCQDHSS